MNLISMAITYMYVYATNYTYSIILSEVHTNMHVLFMHYNLESIDTIDGVYMQLV